SANISNLADGEAEKRLARANGVVARLESLRRGIGRTATDQQLVFRVLRLLVEYLDGIVVVDDLIDVVAGAVDRRALHHRLERLPVVHAIRAEEPLEQLADARQQGRAADQQ